MNKLRIGLKILATLYTSFFAISALAQPNLLPYQPSGWSDKIVVSTAPSSTTDSSPLTTADTLYVDWAVANLGSAESGSFSVALYVDGALKFTWNTSLPAPSYTQVVGQPIGTLSAGTHTLEIVADSGNTVTEGNEGDNSYTKTITVSPPNLPNLTPYQPSGWSDMIVVSTTTGGTTDSSPLMTTNTLYVDWAITNNGTVGAGSFTTSLYVDGTLKNSWNIPSLAAGSSYSVQDYSIGSLTQGNHIITITADSGNAITESSELDNSYTKNITVNSPNQNLPNLSPYQPNGWSDKIVVSTVTNTSTDSSSFSTTNILYVDWAVDNNGGAAAGAFNVSLYVDGTLKTSWSHPSTLSVGSYTFIQDYVLGSLSAGTHTISITADSGNTVAEGNESDNSYSKTITVSQATAPAPTLIAPANNSPSLSTTPSFSWSAVPGASGYRILIASNPADLPTSATASTGGPSIMVNTIVTNNSFTPVEALVPATTYYWEVHVYNNNDIGTWSSVNSFTTSPSPNGLTIIPTFDSSITSDPQAAEIEATINAAIAVYAANFSDPVTVHITFTEMSSGLGENDSFLQPESYSDYRAALVSHATTPDDYTALAYLPGGGFNPVNGNATINIKLPLARALGFNVYPPAGQPDGTVYLHTSIMNLNESTTDPTKYSLFATVSHEVDEVLGIDSALNGLSNGDPAPTGAICPEDLYRFDALGNRSFTTDVNAASYFALDGVTDLARFNQEQGGDFGDWYSYYGGVMPEVQDAYSGPDTAPALKVELRVLDALGYKRVLPQPSIVATSDSNGSISPSGTFSVNAGSSQLFTATPNSGYLVNQWLVDASVVQTGGTIFILSNIQTNHTVQVTFVSKANQTITFNPLPNRALGEPPFAVTASASSGLPVSFSIVSGPATISGGTITLTGQGTVTVQASQSGDANYNAATSVDQSFTVYSPPGMSLAMSGGNNMVITWPTNVPGFTLRSTTNLGPNAVWTTVTPAPMIVNGQYMVTDTFSGPAKFYQLVK